MTTVKILVISLGALLAVYVLSRLQMRAWIDEIESTFKYQLNKQKENATKEK